MDIVAILEQAAQTGEVLKISYHGGSQPGSIREIVPIQISGEYLRAMCLISNEVKTYIIARIQLANGMSLDYNAKSLVEPSDVKSAFAPYMAILTSSGLHIEVSETEISLHQYFKSGKPKKGACLMLTKSDSESRPWYVRNESNGKSTTFGSLAKAVDWFMKALDTEVRAKKASGM